jgi:uncharacterized membrane protein SpoIIM required for sporulation
MYKKSINGKDLLYSSQLFTKEVLGNTLSDQLDELDTKKRMIQYSEADLTFNQNLIKIMYILTIIVTISVLIVGILYIKGYFVGSTTTTTETTTNTFSSLFGDTTSSNSYKSIFGGKKKK